jgi:hypothetical protein
MRRNKWEGYCECSGVLLSGLIPVFIHAKNCPLRKEGVKDWNKER